MSATRVARARLLAGQPVWSDACQVTVPTTDPSPLSTVRGSDRGRRAAPSWARWNDKLDRRYTLGAEEEVMILDPRRWSLVQASDVVLTQVSDELWPHTSPETHAGVVELATGVHRDVDGVTGELVWLRRRFQRELRTMGLSAAAAGTHPLTVWSETKVSGTPRYRHLGESMRVLAQREPTMALHVHVGVPEPEEAIRVFNGLRRHTPVLLALSANSPFWQERDTGFASVRTLIFQAFPRSGLPRSFNEYADYVDAVDPLISSGALADPSFLWWDVRLQPALGTVEVRVMDAQSMVGHVGPLVALVQSLARLELEGNPSGATPGAEVLAENRFLAARDGMAARLIDPAAGRLVPVGEILDGLLADCRPHALALGCLGALDRVKRLSFANGADRQRALAARDGSLEHVVSHLAEQFRPPGMYADDPVRRPADDANRNATERDG
jgi:carboxylate-amine ligase